MSRPSLTFVLLCGSLWLLAWLIPIRWGSSFLPSDTRHIYLHCFYVSLICLGLLFRLPSSRRVAGALLLGVALPQKKCYWAGSLPHLKCYR
jgi:hypothetical protein